ncbi:DUF305 domain-containing protein [Actinoplanes sp. DH11]|uniref:DUF305 domain-containing protein n=1 Tax=Actinoplanes sp. DH11 TaxID=2857011 RepID=UPI001E40189F|nr:DUF305 domain-containing protein [Actinoplanes sp. DH11]
MNRRHSRTFAATSLTVLAAAVAALTACTSGGDRPQPAAPTSATATAPAPSSSPVQVLVPGRPGESAVLSDPGTVDVPEPAGFNSIDVAYVQMMIAHHQQALEMADLAPARAANTGVKNLAARISASQKLEIDYFKGWLRDRNQPESDPSHDHSTMPGGQSPEKIAELTAATGADFDRRFVAMMSEHHRGAQQMTGDLLRSGSDERLSELANESAVEQVVEIERMADLGVS